MAKLGRRILDDERVQAGIARTIAGILRFIERTARVELDMHPDAAAVLRDGRPFVGAYWHGRMLLIAMAWRQVLAATGRDLRSPIFTLSTFHRDGAIMSKATNLLGIGTIRGSQKKGGTEAYRALRQLLKDGTPISLSVDGGKGPRQRIQGGVLLLSRHTGVPVIPVTFAHRPAKRLSTWDRLVLPAPFGRCLIRVGAPIYADRSRDEASLEASRVQLEDALNALQAEADRRMGWEPVEPAPVPSAPPASSPRQPVADPAT